MYDEDKAKYLDADHHIWSVVRDVPTTMGELRLHLMDAHQVSVANRRYSDLLRVHLLAHTILAFPELKVVFKMERWGLKL